jgi:hypothetical protein
MALASGRIAGERMDKRPAKRHKCQVSSARKMFKLSEPMYGLSNRSKQPAWEVARISGATRTRGPYYRAVLARPSTIRSH